MAYVDLNPVRAGITDKPEAAGYTSIRERLDPQFDIESALQSFSEQGGNIESLSDKNSISIKPLLPFSDSITEDPSTGIPFAWKDYLTLVDWTGRSVREDKGGHIPESMPSILDLNCPCSLVHR